MESTYPCSKNQGPTLHQWLSIRLLSSQQPNGKVKVLTEIT
jgi:hypothetical protein